MHSTLPAMKGSNVHLVISFRMEETAMLPMVQYEFTYITLPALTLKIWPGAVEFGYIA